VLEVPGGKVVRVPTEDHRSGRQVVGSSGVKVEFFKKVHAHNMYFSFREDADLNPDDPTT
jgi:hypothetical protein